MDPRRRELRAADLQSGYALELLRGGRALLRLGLRRLGRLRLVRLLAAERELPLVEGDPLLLRLLLLFLLRLLRRLLGLCLGGLRLLAERELALVERPRVLLLRRLLGLRRLLRLRLLRALLLRLLGPLLLRLLCLAAAERELALPEWSLLAGVLRGQLGGRHRLMNAWSRRRDGLRRDQDGLRGRRVRRLGGVLVGLAACEEVGQLDVLVPVDHR